MNLRDGFVRNLPLISRHGSATLSAASSCERKIGDQSAIVLLAWSNGQAEMLESGQHQTARKPSPS